MITEMKKNSIPPVYESPRMEIEEFLPQGMLCQSGGGNEDFVRDDDVDWFNS